jgi:ABC-type sugar transport system permease subunit
MELQTFKNKRIRQDVIKKNIFVWSILFYPMLCFVIFYVGVNINSFIMAFQKRDIYGNSIWYGLENFRMFISMIIEDGGILRIAFKNSFVYYLFNLFLEMPLALLFSYLLYKKLPGSSLVRGVAMLPQVISTLVVTLLFKNFMDNAVPAIAEQIFGKDDFPALLSNPKYSFGTIIFYSIWTGFSSSLIVYSNAMNGVDPDVMHSAHIDGVDSMWQELFYIVLPLIFGTLQTYLLTGFTAILMNAGPLAAFFEAYAPEETYMVGYYYLSQILRGNEAGYNMLAAGGLLMTLVAAPCTWALKKFLDRFVPEA